MATRGSAGSVLSGRTRWKYARIDHSQDRPDIPSLEISVGTLPLLAGVEGNATEGTGNEQRVIIDTMGFLRGTAHRADEGVGRAHEAV